MLQWRHKNIEHTRAGSAGFDVYPILPLVRACLAVVNAAHRTLVLAEDARPHGLVLAPQFNVTERISGGVLDADRIEEIEEQLQKHTLKWERWPCESEKHWYEELKICRLGCFAN